jgi:hypothetical protein
MVYARMWHLVSFTPLDREAKQPVPGRFRVQINAWLLEGFDPDASRSRRWTARRGDALDVGYWLGVPSLIWLHLS